jgi:sugar phosphate permease
MRIVPFLALLYMLSFLDRVNIGFAKQELQVDLGLGAAAYGFGAGIFFIGYILCEVPSNLILHRVGARRWLCRIILTWGLVSAAMAFATGPISFYILRFVLGVAEAGLFPGIVLYLTYWYSDRHRGTAIGLSAYWGLPVAYIVGGPVSGFLLDLDGTGGFQGWQWMFVVEGLLTAAVGVWTWFYLVDKPSDASWLTPAEQAAVEAEVEAEDRLRKHVPVAHSLRDRRVLLFGLVYFLLNLSVYGLTFWLPSTVKAMGHLSNVQVGALSAVPWLCAAVSVLLVARAADRRRSHALLSGLAMLVAAVGLATSASVGPIAAVVALCVAAAGLLAALPTFWVLPTKYLAGAAAAAGIALINAIGNFSGFVAPYFLGLVQDATGSITVGMYVLGASALACGLLLLMLHRRARTESTSDEEETSAPA